MEPGGEAPAPPWLEALNPRQREAVETTEGPLLVLAGAGTGKTRTLVARVAWILRRRLARPSEILAVTFTRKAAGEMRARVARHLGGDDDFAPRWMGTFHSISNQMLRAFPEAAGLRRGFAILDADDQLSLVKAIAAEGRIDPGRAPPRLLLDLLCRWKDLALTPALAAETTEARDLVGARRAEWLMETYAERLRQQNACDFSDLILHPVRAFQNDPALLREWRGRFRYVLVDEYQDVNTVQFLWMRLLAGERSNLCVVGDEDQCIYTWRGASVDHILGFKREFPEARTIALEENYRSTETILEAASSVISHNERRLGKTLFGGKGRGEAIRLALFWNDRGEARHVAERIATMRLQGGRLSEIAVLVRMSAQMRALEDRFFDDKVPYRVVGGTRFYDRMEIRDAVAYLRLLRQDSDDLAFERICNLPRRGIGATTLQRLRAERRSTGATLPDAARRLSLGGALGRGAGRALEALLSALESWRGRAAAMAPADAARMVLEESGYLAMWKEREGIDEKAQSRGENLEALLAAMAGFESLEGFLDHVSLAMEQWEDEEGERVSLMTMHAAKGLEFDTVFLPGWEEGVFPHARSSDGPLGLEEERRLAYVALTRARERLCVSRADTRMLHGRVRDQEPSRFLSEFPEGCLEVDDRRFESAGGRGARSPRPGASGAWSGASGGASGAASDGAWDSAGGAPPRFGMGAPANGAGARRPSAAAAPRPSAASSAWRAARSLRRGMRVSHESFGAGRVLGLDGEWAEVLFEATGASKTILASYLRPC